MCCVCVVVFVLIDGALICSLELVSPPVHQVPPPFVSRPLCTTGVFRCFVCEYVCGVLSHSGCVGGMCVSWCVCVVALLVLF